MLQHQTPGQIEFFFDLVSPFAYMAFQKIDALAASHGRQVCYRAISLAAVKKAAGNTGPSNRDIPPKYAYLKQDLTRWAQLYDVPLMFPDPGSAPVAARETLLAHRGIPFAAQHGKAREFIAAFWRLSWGGGRFVGDPAVLKGAIAETGLPEQAFFDFVASDEAAALLDATTQEACARGIFGVPTMVCNGQMWWGNDRLDMLDRYLSESGGD